MEAPMAAAPPMFAAQTVSLYVGDLHPDVNEGHLYDVFKEFDNLASVRVCRDSSSRRSLCYGYVNYRNREDAARAVEATNNSTLYGKVIRVMWSNRDPNARSSGIGNVFVKNLSDTIDNAKLQELFQKFGTIISCKVSTLDDGTSKGYGFVQFESEDSANDAIKELNGLMVENKKIYVGKFIKRRDRIANPDAKYTNLYVKHLDPEISEDQLMETFSIFGKIQSLAISRDDNGISRCFGFVNFDHPDDARRAMEALNGSKFGSKELYVARAQKKAERQEFLRRQSEERKKERVLKYQGANVYVKNIHDSVTDKQLSELFKECGKITSAKVMRDDNGISKGFGFVCFSSPSEAITAVGKQHGVMVCGKPLYVAIAQRKEERQAHLQMLYAQHMAGLTVTGPSPVYHGAYQPFYYPGPGGVVPQMAGQPGVLYQPLGIRPTWGPFGFGHSNRNSFQPSSFSSRPHRQNRRRTSQGGGQAVANVPNGQESNEPVNAPKESTNKQQAGPKANDGAEGEMNSGSGVFSNPPKDDLSGQGETYTLSSMLAAASPENQKQILGERLYPVVSQQQPELASKITGMLLEMDNSELLLLLESHESLITKVEEAVEVLKLAKSTESGQETNEQNYISSEVFVN